MKKANQKETTLAMAKIRGIARHIRNVEDNCLLLGEKLIERGEVELGRRLIQNGFIHDISKFQGIEWEYMAPGQPSVDDGAKLRLKLAVAHHNRTNPHHPEYWENIQSMPRMYVAEMVADWKARSEEFGTSLRDWIDEQACKRYKFSKDDRVYKDIMEFVDLLCATPFKEVHET